jgi:tetratricopeptide (TPR) repeat protein
MAHRQSSFPASWRASVVRPLVWICVWLVVGAALTANQPADGATINSIRGTGFFVSKQGHVLTNLHIVDACRQVTVQSGRLNGAARVIALDVANDLALLATNLKPARIANWRHSVEADEPVVVYGFPAGSDRTVHGKILGLTGWRNSKLRYTEAGVEPGMSGSAVVDGGGRVVGINVGNLGLTIGRATSSATAGALLDAHGIAHPDAGETKPLPKAEVVEKAKAISVKVTCQLLNQQTDLHICEGVGGAYIPNDKIIQACNRAIASGKLSGEELRFLYERRANAHLNKYQVDLAKRDCDAALKVFEDSDGFRCRARIFSATGDHSRAIAELDEAIRSFPKDTLALWMRAISHVAWNDFGRALADLDQAIEIDPNFANAVWLRGTIFEKMQQHDRAVADFDRAIAIYNDLLKLYSTPTFRADVLAQRGNVYNAKGDRDRAIADYDRAIQIVPNNAGLIANRAQIYNARNDRERAIADFDRVIRLDPSNAKAYNDRGNVYNAKGDRDRAIADFDRTIRLDSSYAMAYFNRGNAFNAKGDRDRAIADFDEAIRLDPNNYAFYNRANAYNEKGDRDRAVAYLDQTIRLNPATSNPFKAISNAFNDRGNIYIAKGDRDRAIADFDHAIHLDPKNSNAFYNRGNAYKM